MSWTKRALEYMREGYTEAEALAIVAAERRAVAEGEARRPPITSPDEARTCTADCCATDDMEDVAA